MDPVSEYKDQMFQNRAYCIIRLQLSDIQLQLSGGLTWYMSRRRSFLVVIGASSPVNTVGSLTIV